MIIADEARKLTEKCYNDNFNKFRNQIDIEINSAAELGYNKCEFYISRFYSLDLIERLKELLRSKGFHVHCGQNELNNDYILYIKW